jgi:hypothetical protein
MLVPTFHDLRSPSPAQSPYPFRSRTFFARLNLRPHPAYFIAQADIEHRLPCILQQVHHLSRRSPQIKMNAVGQQVILRSRAYCRRQAGAKLMPQKPDHLAHALQRETAPPQLAYHRHRDQFIPAVNAPVTAAHRRHDAPLIPPLQLTAADSRQTDHVARCELSLHLEPVLFQAESGRNV